MNRLTTNWLTHPTGDPFADAGGFTLEYLQELWSNENIMDLIARATRIYVNDWNNNLHSFFLNSTITHNSNKGQKGIDRTLSFFGDLLKEKEGGEEGYCRITGQKGKVFNGARDNHIMSGSATLINFHHGFESGIKLSKEALIRMFFVPLGVEQVGDKVAVVISNRSDVTRFLVRQNVDKNVVALGNQQSGSALRSAFSNPVNALFQYAITCIENLKTATIDEENNRSDVEGVTLNLFHFTNFGASPTISLYTLPATVFDFYAFCYQRFKKVWQNFIFLQYSSAKVKGATYDETSQTWVDSKETYSQNTFMTWRNAALEKLLYGQSLIPLFLKHSKTHLFPFKIVELYQINLQHMDKRTVQKIAQVAGFIVDNRSDDDIKKLMTKLNKAKNTTELRSFFLQQQARNYEEAYAEPLFTLEEFANYMFPDGSNWKETRDVLLIAIYQKLHEADKKIEAPLAEEETAEEQD